MTAIELLNEADVRFDYSQYDDINDMVDVNGGWGPLVPFAGGHDVDHEFTADGLQLTTTALSAVALGEINELGPFIFGPDGWTLAVVVRVDSARTINSPAQLTGLVVNADNGVTYAPSFEPQWSLRGSGDLLDTFQLQSYDTDGDALVAASASPDPSTDQATTGVFVMLFVVDVAAQEARARLVSPDLESSVVAAFTKPVPDFAAVPATADYFKAYSIQGLPADFVITLDETLLWNRVLTDPEQDALVAHFTGGGEPEPEPDERPGRRLARGRSRFRPSAQVVADRAPEGS